MLFLRLCSRCVGSAWVPRPCPALDGGPLCVCVGGQVRAPGPHSYHLGRGNSVLGGSGHSAWVFMWPFIHGWGWSTALSLGSAQVHLVKVSWGVTDQVSLECLGFLTFCFIITNSSP